MIKMIPISKEEDGRRKEYFAVYFFIGRTRMVVLCVVAPLLLTANTMFNFTSGIYDDDDNDDCITRSARPYMTVRCDIPGMSVCVRVYL